MSRPVPMVDDLALDAVAWIRHRTAPRTASIPVVGLEGDVQQRLGRSSHEVQLAGVLVGDEVADRLGELQGKATSGEEVVFHADITTALEVEHMVVVEAEFLETAGRPGRYEYFLHLRESPPLPPPAELSPLGGLGDLGLGDLGFDALGDVLDAVSDLAEQAQAAIDAVNDAIASLETLTSLADLAFGSPVEPLLAEGEKLEGVAGVADAVTSLGRLLGGAG
jgi:hypothetical protein